MNREVLWCVFILFIMCLVSATGSGLWNYSYSKNATSGEVPFLPQTSIDLDISERAFDDNSSVWIAFLSFWTFIILYQVIKNKLF